MRCGWGPMSEISRHGYERAGFQPGLNPDYLVVTNGYDHNRAGLIRIPTTAVVIDHRFSLFHLHQHPKRSLDNLFTKPHSFTTFLNVFFRCILKQTYIPSRFLHWLSKAIQPEGICQSSTVMPENFSTAKTRSSLRKTFGDANRSC